MKFLFIFSPFVGIILLVCYLFYINHAGKDAVAQTLEEFKGNAIEVLKNEFINQLQATKEDLATKLKQEIESTTSISVKARDYLYIVLLNIVETFINNISKQILAK